MNKVILAVTLALSGAGCPAWCDEPGSPPAMRMTMESEAKAEPGDEPGTVSRALKAPFGVAGLCAGTLIGVPVQIVHGIKSETGRVMNTLIDDFGGQKNFNTYLLATPLAVPYGIASGTILGFVRGVETGTRHGFDRPFSAESMSLREAEE